MPNPSACHPHLPRYTADGQCVNCYRRARRRPATCHPERFAEARGLCSTCYRQQPDRLRADRTNQRRRAYGLEPEEFDAMVIAQSGRCAVCADPLQEMTVDHCHRTGRVRSLLCNPCNIGLGIARESPQRLRAMAAYVEAHQ